MARKIRILARPSGSHSRDNVNPEARNRASTSRNSAASFSTRPPDLQDLVLEFRLAQLCHVEADHHLRRRAEPPTGGRARDAEIRRDGHVPGAVDEIP